MEPSPDDIGLPLSELEFFVLNEALQSCNHKLLYKIDIGGTYVIVPPQRIISLSKKMDWVMRKIKSLSEVPTNG